MTTRRAHLKQMAGLAALPLAAAPVEAALAQPPAAHSGAPGSGPYHYLGRTPGYREWAIVPKGLTIKTIETFLQEPYALVRITASDGSQGWGQVAPYSAAITVEMLHTVIVRAV